MNFSYGNRIQQIIVPSCGSTMQKGIAVYVDGYNQTNMNELPLNNDRYTREKQRENANTAESILMQYVTSAVVGMEIYVGPTQIPAELADPKYCTVISIWTR